MNPTDGPVFNRAARRRWERENWPRWKRWIESQGPRDRQLALIDTLLADLDRAAGPGNMP